MSYQSFKGAFNILSKNISSEEGNSESKKGRSRVIVVFVLIGIFIVAALRNPSEDQATLMIQDKMKDIIEEKMAENLNEEKDGTKAIGTFFGKMLLPALINIMPIDVTDYILFSTFDVKVPIEGENKSVVQGIILFGKVIPLKTSSFSLPSK